MSDQSEAEACPYKSQAWAGCNQADSHVCSLHAPTDHHHRYFAPIIQPPSGQSHHGAQLRFERLSLVNTETIVG